MARGGAEQADAVGDWDQFVGTAEDRQVRAAQAQCVGDGIVVVLAFQEVPQASVDLIPVAERVKQRDRADEPGRLGEAGVAPPRLGETVVGGQRDVDVPVVKPSVCSRARASA